MAHALTKAGRYQIVSELGRGSMGVVYRGFDPVIGRNVAIKTMRIEGLSGAEFQEYKARFQREAQAAGILAHPNIVTVYDFGEDEGVLFLAMEFLQGKSLQDIVEKQNILPVETIIPMFEQVCSALDHAHKHNIVHRDIKPANIMILDSGLVKVTDFGIAKMMSMGMTQAGQILGTPNYMSPEQVKGRAVDGRSDIFSLGVILYELVTGEKPFGGQNVTTVIYKIINENPIPPRELDSTIHPGLNFVISKALAKNAEERFQTCRELSESLKNYRDSGGKATVVMKTPSIELLAAEPGAAPTRPAAQVPFAPAQPRPAQPRPPAARPRPSRPVPAPSFSAVKAEPRGTSPLVWVLMALILFGGIGVGGYYFLYLRSAAPAPQLQPAAMPPPPPPLMQTTVPAPEETSPGEEETPAGEAALPGAAAATERPAGSAEPGKATSSGETAQAAASAGRAAEPPAKTSPALKYGKISVSSIPPGAQITVDGKSDPAWVTPHTIEGIAAGSHAVILSREGYSSAHRRLAVQAGRTATLNVQLAVYHAPPAARQAAPPPAEAAPAMAAVGIVEIRTQPALPDVEIVIDGKSAGLCPVHARLEAGEHNYTVKRAGVEIMSGKLNVRSGVITTRILRFADTH